MTVRSYLDEDVQVFLAEALRARGIDTVHAYEAGRGGDDAAQLTFSAEDGRCIVSYNRRDFVVLAQRWAETGRSHAGVVVVVRRPPGDVLRALVALSASSRGASLHDQLVYL